MKTKIAGLLLIVIGAVYVFIALSSAYLFYVVNPMGSFNLWHKLLYLVFSIYIIVLGFAVRNHKKWAFNVASVSSALLIAVALLFFSLGKVLDIIIYSFVLYALYSEKKLFFKPTTKDEEVNWPGKSRHQNLI